MRTSLVEIAQIEDWFLKRGDVDNRLMTEAKLQSNPRYKEQAEWQLKSYEFIHQYGQEQLRQEIKALERQLFFSSKYTSFQRRIQSIFKF